MKTKDSTVLPYVLGGRDDPHFSDRNPTPEIPSQTNETCVPEIISKKEYDRLTVAPISE